MKFYLVLKSAQKLNFRLKTIVNTVNILNSHLGSPGQEWTFLSTRFHVRFLQWRMLVIDNILSSREVMYERQITHRRQICRVFPRTFLQRSEGENELVEQAEIIIVLNRIGRRQNIHVLTPRSSQYPRVVIFLWKKM